MAPKLHNVLLAPCAVLLILAVPLIAGDPDMLQDICVADYRSLQGPLRLNGYPCKREANVTADDFFFCGLGEAADVRASRSPMGSAVTAADVETVPGLNTLGVSMARTDYAPCGGASAPHAHPRASEIIFVAEGALEVGFLTAANKLFTRTVSRGEVFVFPRGLVHFERGVGEAPAVAISAFDSQLPGTQTVGEALFGAAPAVPTDVLTRALQIDGGVVESIKSKFAPKLAETIERVHDCAYGDAY